MKNLVGRKDLDMSAIEAQVQTHYTEEDAHWITEAIADAMIDGIGILMSADFDDMDAPIKAVDCWVSQVASYGMEKDQLLLDMVDDAFLYLSVEAGIREMESIDPTQFYPEGL